MKCRWCDIFLHEIATNKQQGWCFRIEILCALFGFTRQQGELLLLRICSNHVYHPEWRYTLGILGRGKDLGDKNTCWCVSVCLWRMASHKRVCVSRRVPDRCSRAAGLGLIISFLSVGLTDQTEHWRTGQTAGQDRKTHMRTSYTPRIPWQPYSTTKPASWKH